MSFREFKKTTEEVVRKPIQGTSLFNEYIVTRYHVRLGPQIFSTNQNLTDIRIESHNASKTVSAELLKEKPYILSNLRQEVNDQRKKERKSMFAKDCFHRTPYSANQRIAYHNAKSN
ncbi:hypothetical protein F900_01025 [Acinetobacter modestus]|uniref:Uncharacterized protein n=1 Tax=Acinetobacter modestus TaxID=1776740 RepID=N9M269_9GAMM|nr:hypothetical protein [Acinetobacter modestus]ENX02579.1 hypothetical protein F900_01025 [Acinetobacter modestus]